MNPNKTTVSKAVHSDFQRRVKFKHTGSKDQYDAYLVTGTITSDVWLGSVFRFGPTEWHAYREPEPGLSRLFRTRDEAGRFLAGDRLSV